MNFAFGSGLVRNPPGQQPWQTTANLILGSSFVGAASALSIVTQASPDGQSSTTLITEDTTTGAHTAAAPWARTAATNTYTYTVYVKPSGRNFAVVLVSSAGSGAYAYVNLTAGAVTSGPAVFGTGFSAPSAVITLSAGGFIKVVLTFTVDNSKTAMSAVIEASPNGTTDSYAGTSTACCFFYGATVLKIA